MKIPKTIRLNGFDWKVTLDKNNWGASFDWDTKEFTIGTRSGEEGRNLIHEIIEALFVDLELRYRNNDTKDFLFCFNHSQFTIFCNQLYQVLKENGWWE